VGPREAADHGMGRIATGFRERRLLRPRRELRRRDQVAGVDLRVSDQPLDDVDVVAAVVGDIGHRTLADIDIPCQARVPGPVDATQPEIVIASGVEIGACQPLLLPRNIRWRPIARTLCIENRANHRAQKGGLRAREEVSAVGVEDCSIVLNLVEEVLDHAPSQIHPAVA